MADTITSSNTLSIGIEYTDNNSETKTTSIHLTNFSSNVTESDIKNAFQNNNVLSYGHDSSGLAIPITPENIMTASTTKQTINNIDIGWED